MKKIFVFILILVSANIFSEGNSYADLLEYRLQHDALYSTIKNNRQIAKNNYDIIKLNSYFTANLTTGDINLLLDSDKSKSSFSMQPSASLGSPKLNNLGLQFSLPYSNLGNGLQTKQGFDIGLGFDIYSQVRNKANLQIDNAKRNLMLAEKQLAIQKQLIEKKFLFEVKTLLSEYALLLKSKLNTTNADLKYRQLKVQGYKQNTTMLGTAKLNLMRVQREEKEAEFSFSNTINKFLDSCNLKIENKDTDSFLLNLSKSIPKAKLISPDKLTEQNYSELLNAEEEYKNFLLKNKIELSPFSARVNTKYSNSKTSNKNFPNNINTQNIQAGLTMLVPGCEFYTGAIFTLEPKDSPSPNLQFKFTINPMEIYNFVKNKENAKLNEENKLTNLKELKNNFQIEINRLIVKRNKFEWQEKLFMEETEIYKQNAIEYLQLFEQGIISELEKDMAELEYSQAILRETNAKIDSLIFNIEVIEKFNNL